MAQTSVLILNVRPGVLAYHLNRNTSFKCRRASEHLITCVDQYYNFIYLMEEPAQKKFRETIAQIIARNPQALEIVVKQVNSAVNQALQYRRKPPKHEEKPKEGEGGK